MKITLLPSSFPAPGTAPQQYLTSYLLNDSIAIDAGSLGFYKNPIDQAAVRHVFLSHTHIDHLASLPIFLENVAGMHATPVTVYATEAVERCLRLDFFNGRVWPNFLELTNDGVPFMTLERIESGKRVDVNGLGITPIAVDHVVPTLGFVIDDSAAAVAISSDTGPTEPLWEFAKTKANLKGVFLEVTFPNGLRSLADLTKHLTPDQLLGEVGKLSRPVRYYAVHVRARLRDQVIRELLALGLPNLQIAEFGMAYEF